ncbi:TIGR03032 family protein [Leptolyngbya sp. FACHB-16]|uniref:TIGR03032 family protein n=1 Tax=unclassified Leptolyngbya TaxID=2650499 RepID=UPI001683CC91|nr:TIGR03032 family protein [Leptolyngbya sp. FACHB-16]MBD2153422.1 TIGR03032 family protein [Leptolyngbya sp. FACHB-16]
MASPTSEIQRLTELGVLHCQQGNFAQGVACFQEALTLQPEAIDGRYNLALAYQKQGNHERALTEYERLLAQQPDYVPALVQTANLRQMQQQYQAAIALYQKALALQPQNAQAHCNLGTALQSVGATQAAIAAYEKALALQPQYPEACNGLGSLRERQGLASAAIALYEQALARRSNWVPALINLAQVRFRLEQWEAAIALYRQVLALEPNNLKAWDGLLAANLAIAQWSELDTFKTQIEKLASTAPLDIAPLNTLYLPFSATEQRRLAEGRAEAIAQRMADTRRQFQFPARRPKPKIRLGYVSGDFRHHAVAHLMLRLFELHDREQFEVFAYSLGPDDSSTYRQKLMADCDQFRDVLGMSPAEIAQQIHQDGIDILIDLAGYTDYGCPELFALRPAPLQVNYLGYPGTLGQREIDYILTDSVITPPELAHHFTETCVYLPGCYQLNNNQQLLPTGTITRAQCGLPEEAVVFCCFNKVQKIEPSIFMIWMRILQQVPQSVLWLLESNPLAHQNLVRAAEQLGVAGDRLIFAPRLPKAEHLDRHPCADLFLDTRYYTAHTTGSDALWAGVPLITIPGETFASRVSASLLNAVHLPELVATTLEDYEHLAIHLATHPEERQRLRQHLQENRLRLPLFESDRTVRQIEAAYQQIWKQESTEKQGEATTVARSIHPSPPPPQPTSSPDAFSCHASDGFHSWLAQSGGSIVISTYQAGKVVLVGFDGQQITVLLRQFTKPMGMAMQGNRWVLATQYEVMGFANAPLLAHEYIEAQRDRYDALYLPRVSYYTNDLNIHDLAFGKDGLWLVNTRFSCLAALSEDFNFVPRWHPSFITELAPEDRCHLNGLAIVEGQPKYVTALGATDIAGGWREHKATGGILIDVESNELLLQGLCMPHSPRWHDGYLWFLNSGAGEVCRLDVATGDVETVCVLPGFLRGLECIGSYALVGLSQIRERHIFGGLPVSMRGDRLLCGVAIIDLQRGIQVGMLEFTAGCQELYDVKFLTGIQRPMLLNPDKPAVREAIAAPEFAYWLRPSKQLPT